VLVGAIEDVPRDVVRVPSAEQIAEQVAGFEVFVGLGAAPTVDLLDATFCTCGHRLPMTE
jgi:hypothetical protein